MSKDDMNKAGHAEGHFESLYDRAYRSRSLEEILDDHNIRVHQIHRETWWDRHGEVYELILGIILFLLVLAASTPN